MVAGTTGAVLTQVPAPLHSNPLGQQGPTELQAPAVHAAVAAGGRVQTPGRAQSSSAAQQALPQATPPEGQLETGPQLPFTHWPAGQQPVPHCSAPLGQQSAGAPQTVPLAQQPPGA